MAQMVCSEMGLRLLRCNGVGSFAIRSGLLCVKPALRELDHHNSTAGSIDLWNKDTLTSPGLEERATSFLRFRVWVPRAWHADLAKSKQVLFWEIKRSKRRGLWPI
jgi:hypothetical protein